MFVIMKKISSKMTFFSKKLIVRTMMRTRQANENIKMFD